MALAELDRNHSSDPNKVIKKLVDRARRLFHAGLFIHSTVYEVQEGRLISRASRITLSSLLAPKQS